MFRALAIAAVIAIAAYVVPWPPGGGEGDADPTAPDRPAPVPARALLPDAEGSDRLAVVFENPRLNQAVGLVADFVPRYDRAFDVVKLVDNVSAALECLYERDHLAVAGYRDPDHVYSVGLVIVVSDAVAGDLLGSFGCTLENVLRSVFASGGTTTVPSRPSLDPCFDVTRVDVPGGTHTVARLASTDWMCDDLLDGIRDRSAAAGATVGAVEDRLVPPEDAG